MASTPSSSTPSETVTNSTFMPDLDVLGVGRDVDEFPADAGAAAVDDRRHEGHLDAGDAERHDGVRPHRPGGVDVDRREFLTAA